MRTHGWGGDPPTTDEEARARILDATRRCLERSSGSLSIVAIAEELGVTRPTIYRYFPSTNQLLQEAAQVAAAPFLERLADHLRRLRLDPPELLTECVAVTLEEIHGDPWLSRVFVAGRTSVFSEGVTSEVARSLGRKMLAGLDVDWVAAGFDEAMLDDVVEQMLRMLQSLIVDPGLPPRTDAEQRAYLRRWFTPAVAALATNT